MPTLADNFMTANFYNSKFDTRISLLQRLQDCDPSDEGWQEFVARYAALLKNWCRNWGVGASDIDDVVQETLIAVVTSLPSFEHRGTGSFRGWMKTIARRCFAQLVKHCQRNPVACALALDGSHDRACEKLIDSFDEEARRELFSLSAKLVKSRVAETTWRAFEMSAIDGLPGAQIAETLGIHIGSVYVSRGRVQRMISETIAELDHDTSSS